jgi:uncharacterized membrane protein YphA (DoxX/SURF4 family)
MQRGHDLSAPEDQAVVWKPATRLAFRFVLVYGTLYAAATQILGGVLLLPDRQLPALGHVWPLREITTWLAEHLFGVAPPLVFRGNSGDTAFHWVQTVWLLAAAGVSTAAWSALDRARREYAALHAWFRLFVRFALAAQMFYYGMAKVVPSQFPPPSLVTLVEPVGNLSLSDLLWTFVGASTAYQVFTGLAEVLAGLLLLAPATTMIGALVAAADMMHVFVLNMTYDVGLKQISLHLLAMAVFLLAPDLRRLAGFFLLDRPAPSSGLPPLVSSPRGRRLALAAQLLFGVYLLAMFTSVGLRYYRSEGGAGGPKSVLYGLWDVEEMSLDGVVRPPSLNDYDRRWRRVIFDAPRTVVFQRTDDSFAHYGAAIDAAAGTVTLTKGGSRSWGARFTFERPSRDRLALEGEMDRYRVRLRLRLVELDTFRLLNSRFRWIRPPDPFAG